MQPKSRMTFRFDSPPKPQKDKPSEVRLESLAEKREQSAQETAQEIYQTASRKTSQAESQATSEITSQAATSRSMSQITPQATSQAAAPQETSRATSSVITQADSIRKMSRTSWYSGGPLQDDPYTLEELIRSYETQTGYSPAAGQGRDLIRGGNGSFGGTASGSGSGTLDDLKSDLDDQAEAYGWTLQDDESRIWKMQRTSQDSGPSWWRALTSVAGAIATGALLGYLVLTLIAGESLFSKEASGGQAQGAAPSVQASEAPASGAVTGTAPDSAAPPPAPADVRSLPEEKYYFLQYGVFRTDEGLDAALAALAGRGLPAAADRLNGFRAYAGAAPSREVAELLADQMPDVEVYIKPVTVAALKAPMPEESGAFIISSHQLARQLLRLSALALQDELPQPLEEAELEALQENHRLWLQTVNAAGELPGAGRQAGEAMIRAMNEAMAHVEDYSGKMSRFHLWGIQKNMMELILADQAWRANMEGGRF
jgi:hypothetical protein